MANGWDSRADVTGDALDNKVDPEAYAQIWGAWRGREQEFFRRCAGLVSPLSFTDVLAICGPETRVHARLMQEAYRALTSEDLPPVLEVGSMQLAQMTRTSTRVSTYSGYDPLDVPHRVMELHAVSVSNPILSESWSISCCWCPPRRRCPVFDDPAIWL
jgi:hypothetical protein